MPMQQRQSRRQDWQGPRRTRSAENAVFEDLILHLLQLSHSQCRPSNLHLLLV